MITVFIYVNTSKQVGDAKATNKPRCDCDLGNLEARSKSMPPVSYPSKSPRSLEASNTATRWSSHCSAAVLLAASSAYRDIAERTISSMLSSELFISNPLFLAPYSTRYPSTA